MRITDLPYDIHTVILSKIYSVEDYINYCETFNINCNLDLCEEITDSIKIIGKCEKTYDVIIDDNCYLNINDFGFIINISVWTNINNLSSKETNIKQESLHELFNNKIINIYTINMFHKIVRYLHGAKKIKIINPSDMIDNNVRSAIMNINVYGNLCSNNINLYQDINLFKVFAYNPDNINIHRRVKISYLNKIRDIIGSYDCAIEQLIITLERCDSIIISCMPNLKILTLILYGTIKTYNLDIKMFGLPKLKAIFYSNKLYNIKINIPNIKIYDFVL